MIALTVTFIRRSRGASIAALAISISQASPAAAIVDDFSDAQRHGAARILVDDKAAGSQSHATQSCSRGVLAVKGQLVPGRGAPAFISIPLLLAADASPQDVSHFEGIRLRVKIQAGNISVQASSADITNFDYHVSAPLARKPGEFQEVRIAFKDLKRSWSEQIPLNLKTMTSINLLAFGMAPDAFAYEVDEVGFY